MKKNLTKLALSGAALAAVAATLGTSTYAWYTTNPTVSANNIVAGTSDTGSSSIFISKDKASVAKKSWSSRVTLTSADFMVSSPSLVPLNYTNGNQGLFSATQVNTTTTGEGTSAVTTKTTGLATAADAGANVAYVQLHFKSSKTTQAQSIYIKSITVENTTDKDTDTTGNQLPFADNLLYDGTTSTAVNGIPGTSATYCVDFRNALSLAVYNAGTQANTGSYDKAFSLATYKSGTNPVAPSGSYLIASNQDAQGYFDAVMEADLEEAAKASAGAYDAGAIAVCPTDGTNYATVNFYVYLDGGSQWCYDACQGQQFAINLEFTSDAASALNHA